MAWLVGTIFAAGAATMGVLLARVERVRIQTPTGSGVDTPADPVVSSAARRG